MSRSGELEGRPAGGRRLAAAVAASALLHALVLGALWRASRRGPAAPARGAQTVEISVVDHPRPGATPARDVKHAPPASLAGKRAPPARSAVASRAPARAEERPGGPTVEPGGAAPSAAAVGEATPADAPRALALDAPFRAFGGTGGGSPADTGGETIVGTPAPEAPRARAERARAHVNDWIADGAAEDRVEEGLVDSYYTSVGKSVERAFADTEKHVRVKRGKGAVGAESALLAWSDSASHYAATGNPGEPAADLEDERARYGLGPSTGGPDPGVNEQQRPITATGSALPLFDGSGGGLTVVVELRQRGDGKFVSVELKQRSTDPDFDAWVLAEIPEGLATLPPPPAFGAGLHKDGLRSLWAFTGKVSYMRKVDDIQMKDDWWYLPAAAALAMLGGHFDIGSSSPEMIDLRHPHFIVTSKLLRVY
ncbi:MAG: TonB C-terminal domain-containing protein [Myxococcales bacterium]